MFRRLIIKTVRLMTFWAFGLTVEGKENLPEKGPAVFCFNHNDLLDALIVVFAIDRDLWGIGAWEYRFNPFMILYLLMGRLILIKRKKSDTKAIRKALKVLKEGKFLAVSPEGTRSKNGQLASAEPGPTLLAGKTNSPIVPVAIIDSTGTFRNLFRKRPRIRVVIGKPFKLSVSESPAVIAEDGRKAKIDWQKITDEELMPRIAALLPANMRGVYG